MKPPTPQVTVARIEADSARARLMATAQVLQDRLRPGTLARDAWEGAKMKGADLAEDAVPRDARLVVDDRGALLGEAVEERALADVRPADDGDEGHRAEVGGTRS